MSFRVVVLILWGAFGLYWLVAAAGAKPGPRRARSHGLSLLILAVFVLVRVVRVHGLEVHSRGLQAAGLLLLVCGLGLAVWARVFLGRNWGMPMTEKDDPELVTSGPYGLVRHPIYSGLVLGMVGTALALNLYLLIVAAAGGAYFLYSARVEERRLAGLFPAAYPDYRSRTKMLVPFLGP
jgi:protein-S-isoprenylcysteine O-methyltransferase Ste14